MNNYVYTDLEIGHSEEFIANISEEDMVKFYEITKDANPLHNDLNFARKKGYDSKVVYGMLTSSFLSTLAGVYLPGERSLIYEVEQKFVTPVFVGDILRVRGVISDKNDMFQILTINVEIRNQHDKKVLRGKMKVGVLNE